MCTIGIIYRVHAEFPLIIAANRDEFYARPARPPERFGGDKIAVGGVDAVSGGTWLGVTGSGRIVAVTNQRAATPPDPLARSRGLAVRDALFADSLDTYVDSLDPHAYSSMNLLFGDANSLSVAYFRRGETAAQSTRTVTALQPGVHVLCNDRLGAADFPRGQRLARELERVANAPWPSLRDALATVLADHQHTPPNAEDSDDAMAWALSSVCIHSPLYGTRSSSIVALTEGGVHSYEHAEGSPCVHSFANYAPLLR